MRSVILRSRPGRPRWQLTTRPATAALLGVISAVAALVQLALLSSPTPWYQPAVAGFWTVVGLAFLGSAAGTRARDRRAAAEAARALVPVDAVPFVPVPIRPARPRRRDEPARDADSDASGEVHTGEPTDDLADAVQTAATPEVGRPATSEPRRPAVPEVWRPAVPVTRAPAAPAGAVPSPRRALERTGPERTGPERTGPERAVSGAVGRRRAVGPRGVPACGDSGRHVSPMTFGGSAGRAGAGPTPTDTGRHAMVEPRDVPAPRESTTSTPRRARHAAPQAKDRVR